MGAKKFLIKLNFRVSSMVTRHCNGKKTSLMQAHNNYKSYHYYELGLES